MELWKRAVAIRLNDLYRGMDLKNALELAKPISENNFDKAEKLFREQGHSGMSHSVVCSILETFMPNGGVFVKHMKALKMGIKEKEKKVYRCEESDKATYK